MKIILAFILFTSMAAHCQECKLKSSTDPYTKETRLSTGFIFGTGGSITVDADSKEIDFLISLEGADQCYDNNSSAYLFFEGVKSKSMLRNNGSMNCEGLFHFIFKNSPGNTSMLQKFSTQKVTHIIFTGNNKKETTFTLDEKQREALMLQAACLIRDAKKLIR